MPDEDEESDELPPDLQESIGSFLSAWAMIEKRKVSGWMLLMGIDRRELTDEFVDGLQVFDAELQRMESEAEAERNREMRDRAESRRG